MEVSEDDSSSYLLSSFVTDLSYNISLKGSEKSEGIAEILEKALGELKKVDTIPKGIKTKPHNPKIVDIERAVTINTESAEVGKSKAVLKIISDPKIDYLTT